MSDYDKLLDDKKATNDEERGAAKWEPEEGDKLSGFLMKSGWYDGNPEYPPSLWILVKDEDGDTHRVYCPTVLRGQLVEEAPAIGSGIAIRYEGRVDSQTAGRRYHSYTLALIPDKSGRTKTDDAYWRVNGTYGGGGGASGSSSNSSDDDGSFF